MQPGSQVTCIVKLKSIWQLGAAISMATQLHIDTKRSCGRLADSGLKLSSLQASMFLLTILAML